MQKFKYIVECAKCGIYHEEFKEADNYFYFRISIDRLIKYTSNNMFSVCKICDMITNKRIVAFDKGTEK